MMALDSDTLLLKRLLREASIQAKKRCMNVCYVTKIPLILRQRVADVSSETYPLFLLPCVRTEAGE
ncbi:MAG: hypothetical protein AYK23_04860 [Candidatus Proteinoplasmatales archaeon SG8-5]|nr:MAG: hypothetical protein AYK23_04860 [Candidatus Proteinoplasmatales archaeon SG8-5]